MSYFLKADPKNYYKGKIVKLRQEDAFYEIPSEFKDAFEVLLSGAEVKYERLEEEEGMIKYALPLSAFEFEDAEVISLDPISIFLEVPIMLWDKIEETGNAEVAVEYSVMCPYKNEFERWAKDNKIYTEFLFEDDWTSTYLVSYKEF